MDMLRRIGMVRKRVMQSFRLISTKADVIKTIITRYMNQMESAETKFYLEDIHDHVLTMMQNLSHYEKSLARSHSNYLAQISIDITQASNRTSDTVMRMTLLASILVPLNVITGLFGMNVRVPGKRLVDLGMIYCLKARLDKI
jgi:magnesium transporter